MNKFISSLTQDTAGIKATRANMLADQTSIVQQTLVNNLKMEKLNLENKLAQLTDLSPDNDYSLRPGGINFDATKWVNEVQAAKVEILNKKIELQLAEETFNEWFSNEPTPSINEL